MLVGDRGMIRSKAIDELRESDGIGWITALKSVSIRALVEQGQLQLGLFDERNLFELSSPEYPGERLVACRNPELAKLRAHKRGDLLAATETSLEKIKARVDAGKLAGSDEIGVRVGKVINQYKVAKHFELEHRRQRFSFARKLDAIAAEAALDGIYIIRTSVSAAQMDAPTCVRNYKSLAQVERAFRSLKTIDLKVRPIHHRLADRVRAHIFLCMLAYYVEWHMREAWRELMFADNDQLAKATRDPVAPAKRSKAAQAKAASHTLDDGTPAHSFSTLLADLAAIVRNTCRTPKPRLRRPPSRSSPLPTPSSSAPSNCSRRSSCRQQREPHSHAKRLSYMDKCDQRSAELRFSRTRNARIARSRLRDRQTDLAGRTPPIVMPSHGCPWMPASASRAVVGHLAAHGREPRTAPASGSLPRIAASLAAKFSLLALRWRSGVGHNQSLPAAAKSPRR